MKMVGHPWLIQTDRCHCYLCHNKFNLSIMFVNNDSLNVVLILIRLQQYLVLMPVNVEKVDLQKYVEKK